MSPDAVFARLPDADAERIGRRSQPATDRPLSVAVVGAGLSGLACARTLADHGHRVRVFEKARGAGGRMSTRRTDAWRFDHGAQYFTVRDPRFGHWLESWTAVGIVARWDGRVAVLEDGAAPRAAGGVDRFVGTPGMNAVCRHLAADLEVVFDTRVGALARAADRWRLVSVEDADLGAYDAVVVSAPAPQTAELLTDAAPRLAARAAGVTMTPCWAAMISFAEPLQPGFDAAFVHGSRLSWVARNASKPGRPDADAWVLHASAGWSRQKLELDPVGAAQSLLDAFRTASGVSGTAQYLDGHLWRFALPAPLDEPCLFDAELRLAACGDWCGGPRVEGAFLSGVAAASRLLARRPATVQTTIFGAGT